MGPLESRDSTSKSVDTLWKAHIDDSEILQVMVRSSDCESSCTFRVNKTVKTRWMLDDDVCSVCNPPDFTCSSFFLRR